MNKFLILTDGLHNSNLPEIVNLEEISNVFPNFESVGGFFSEKKIVTSGSVVLMKNGHSTYVKETPEQLLEMIKGAQQ